MSRGIAFEHQDVWDAALRVFEEAMPHAESLGESETFARTLINAAYIRLTRGEFDQSRRYYEWLIDLRERTSSQDYVANALTIFGDLLFLQGEWGVP